MSASNKIIQPSLRIDDAYRCDAYGRPATITFGGDARGVTDLLESPDRHARMN
jgi:hypothetical protein